MTAYHVQIALENRKPTVNPDGTLNSSRLATPVSGQLHTLGTSIKDITNANILYAATWDGVSPWIVILKGSNLGLTMLYAGWPTVDEATWKASQPIVM